MSSKKLKQKLATALIVAMSATSVLPAVAATVGTPSTDGAVKVTFVGGGGTWGEEIASKSTASKANAEVASWSNTERLGQIERTYIVDRSEGSQYVDDDKHSYISLENTADFENGVDWREVEREGYEVVGWYSDDVYIDEKTTQIYNGATLTAQWQSDKVQEPDIESEVINQEDVVVGGLEDGQQFILSDIQEDSEADTECMSKLDEALAGEDTPLQVYGSKDDIVKLDIDVSGYRDGQKVTITLPVPKKLNLDEGFGSKYDVKIVHFKKDRTEILSVKFDDGWNFMTFHVTSGFSPFYIVKTEVSPADPDDQDPGTTTPSTPDDENPGTTTPSTPDDENPGTTEPPVEQEDPTQPGNNGGSGSGNSGGGSSGGGGGSSSTTKDYTMHGTWVADGNGWKFRKDSGEYATNTWGLINGKWYFFDAQGNMVTGWYQVNGVWYFLTPEAGANQGAMVTGWRFDTTYNAWFYLNASGAMATGWQQINGVWYYLNPVSDGTMGAMAANTTVDGYYVNADGAWVQ